MFLSDPLPILQKWFCSAEQNGLPTELKTDKPFNDISHASGQVSK